MLLLLDILLVGVADKIDVFADFAGAFLLGRVEGLLLFKFVEAGRVDLGFELGAVRCLFNAHLVPVGWAEELVLHNFLDSVAAETMLSVTHQTLEQVSSRRGQFSLGRDLKGLAPMQDFLTCD